MTAITQPLQGFLNFLVFFGSNRAVRSQIRALCHRACCCCCGRCGANDEAWEDGYRMMKRPSANQLLHGLNSSVNDSSPGTVSLASPYPKRASRDRAYSAPRPIAPSSIGLTTGSMGHLSPALLQPGRVSGPSSALRVRVVSDTGPGSTQEPGHPPTLMDDQRDHTYDFSYDYAGEDTISPTTSPHSGRGRLGSLHVREGRLQSIGAFSAVTAGGASGGTDGSRRGRAGTRGTLTPESPYSPSHGGMGGGYRSGQSQPYLDPYFQMESGVVLATSYNDDDGLGLSQSLL